MMKQLKKTVLFGLGLGTNLDPPTSDKFEFSYELLYQLIPYAPVSIRGAVSQLKEEAAVSVYLRDGQTRIALTSVGAESLKTLFPALRHIGGKKERIFTVCIFREGDRRGREVVLTQGFFNLARGVYVFPGSTPAELTNTLSRLGILRHVLLFETRRMVVGDESSLIRQLFNLKLISKQSEQLNRSLTNLHKRLLSPGKLHPQTKAAFVSLLPGLMEFFAQNLSVPEIYFPQETRLSDIKTQLFQVSAVILPKL